MTRVLAFNAARLGVPHRPTGTARCDLHNTVVLLNGLCPSTEFVTRHDRENIALYARLLDLEVEGFSEGEMAEEVFKLDSRKNPGRARYVVQTHLRRAHWMQKNVFPMLGW